MTTMLERAARAAFNAYWSRRDSDPDSQEYWWKNSKENFIDETRAVLMAVRIKDPADLADQILNEQIDAILEGK